MYHIGCREQICCCQQATASATTKVVPVVALVKENGPSAVHAGVSGRQFSPDLCSMQWLLSRSNSVSLSSAARAESGMCHAHSFGFVCIALILKASSVVGLVSSRSSSKPTWHMFIWMLTCHPAVLAQKRSFRECEHRQAIYWLPLCRPLLGLQR
jgi:hypothetical protein